jgi:hypothetical protein
MDVLLVDLLAAAEDEQRVHTCERGQPFLGVDLDVLVALRPDDVLEELRTDGRPVDE